MTRATLVALGNSVATSGASGGARRRASARVVIVALAVLAQAAPDADVLRSSPTGFELSHSMLLQVAPLRAYRALVDDVGRWWDPAHTFTGDASNLSIDARPGGCFCETLPDGGGTAHLVVVTARPGALLRLSGGLGPLQAEAVAGTMTWSLEAEEQWTRITVTYVVSGTVEGGLESWATPVDGVVGAQLQRLADFIQRRPAPGARR